MAYRNAPDCRAWARDRGFDDAAFEFFSSPPKLLASDTQAFVAQNEQMMLIAFRGTQPNQAADWLSDLKTAHVAWRRPGTRVHEGFHAALESVWSGLSPRIAARGNRSVWITGHSLGGALATLCAAEARVVLGARARGVYTFGQPRVGNGAFADFLNQELGAQVFRHVNDKDIVPRVPLFGMGFHHWGREAEFNERGERRERPASVETVQEAVRSFVGAFLRPGWLEQLNLGTLTAKVLVRGHGAVLEEVEARVRDGLREIAHASVENIADHDMKSEYLRRLGTTLE